MIGTALSPWLFTWRSNEELEEKIAAGRVRFARAPVAPQNGIFAGLCSMCRNRAGLFDPSLMPLIVLVTSSRRTMGD